MKHVKFTLLVIFALIGDGFTTYTFTRMGLPEGNPLLKDIIYTEAGFALLILFKITWLALVWQLRYNPNVTKKVYDRLLIALSAMFGIVTLINMIGILVNVTA